MARKETKTKGKLLDFWERPPECGDPVGCLATTFTFHADLFEEECLRRFLGIESDSATDEYFPIELETRLSQVEVGAFVDATHSFGNRSPRWRLIPVKVSHGVQHAKVSLLVWGEFIRVIIASANLTRDGYRYNNELFTVFDFHPGAPARRDTLSEALDFFRRLNENYGSAGPEVKSSISRLIDRAKSISARWKFEEPEYDHSLAFVFPGGKNLLEVMKDLGPNNSPFTEAIIESPSFEQPGKDKNRAAAEVWNALRKRGGASVQYRVCGRRDDKGDKVEIYAPKELLTSKPPRDNCVLRLDLLETVDEGSPRPVHGKWIELREDRVGVLCLGSSNFSSPAMGLGKATNSRTNIEANVIIRYRRDRERSLERQIDALRAKGSSIDPQSPKTIWLPDKAGSDFEIESPPYPSFIESITFRKLDGEGIYFIRMQQTAPDFQLVEEGPNGTIYNLAPKKGDSELQIPIGQRSPSSQLRVKWEASEYLFPVNIENQEAVPPPNFLLSLTLEELEEILGSQQSLQRAIKKILRRKQLASLENRSVVLDPHAKVNTSSFILQRTRKLARVLKALRKRLEAPALSQECLSWRLKGPFGIQAVKKAALAPLGGPDERAFFLLELILELQRAHPLESSTSIPKAEVEAGIRTEIEVLRKELAQAVPDLLSGKMKEYISTSVQKL
jgi:hypothetical protein